ncbi:hypothetical protein EW146_g9349 [Bondarzewia mesenterica]|uniref:Haloacid dehalogenase, type II n=1 Tax=Bondarzewia mesenterica TaxID=1095465 RepID=A0A4S4L7C7_9AGAM|nr:hypothetical protein EW146_g9349 [Bondarzewia mesenterica]
MITTALSKASLTPYTTSLPYFLSSSLQTEPKKYKPSRELYVALLDALDRRHVPHTVWLISANPFDVTGARVAGMNALWVDRTGKGWTDRLVDPIAFGPSKVVRNLEDVSVDFD